MAIRCFLMVLFGAKFRGEWPSPSFFNINKWSGKIIIKFKLLKIKSLPFVPSLLCLMKTWQNGIRWKQKVKTNFETLLLFLKRTMGFGNVGA